MRVINGDFTACWAMLVVVGTFDGDEHGNFARFGVLVGYVGHVSFRENGVGTALAGLLWRQLQGLLPGNGDEQT
jgi:hypothetical protein